MRRRRALVAGAGVAGLTAALLLRRQGFEVQLQEATDGIGGLLRPVRFRGVDCDLGSHRIHPAALGEPVLAELAAAAELVERPRHGRIVLGGRLLPYPLSLPSLLTGLGPRRAFSFAGSLLRRPCAWAAWERDRRLTPGSAAFAPDVGFAAFVTARVGRAAYEAFYRPYAEKVWGIDPADLSQSVAKARVSSRQPLCQLACALVPSRAATYLYPRRGMAGLLAALVARVHAARVGLEWGRPAGRDVDADAILHTGPLGVLAATPAGLPEPGLGHRGVYLVFLALAGSPCGETETFYVPERRFWFGRVGVVGNYSPQQGRAGETALCLEIPEGRWGRGVDFGAHLPALMDQLVEAGVLARPATILEHTQHFESAVYPLQRRGWHATWRAALTTVTADGRTWPVGRQGLWLHCNLDHAMATARRAVEAVSAGRDARHWPADAVGLVGATVRD
ncbi:MAG: UDP-galactopyranose mutase [Myxococcales bacterium]|nr:UDP-galactopyranose mutase [Myxococcales bacterium]